MGHGSPGEREGGGGGITPQPFWWGCAVRFLETLIHFQNVSNFS